MSINEPAALAAEPEGTATEVKAARWAWVGSALTVVLAVAAVLLVSIVAAVTNL